MQVGLGKTVAVATACSDIIAEDEKLGKLRRFLVLAPRRVARDVWPREIEKWDHIRHLRVARALGGAAKRKAAILDPNAHLVTMNYENVTWLLNTFKRGQLPFYGIIMDEADKFKDPGTGRFDAMRWRIDEFEWRVAMTGTPTPENLFNIWGLSYMATAERTRKHGKIVRTAVLGSSSTDFKGDYFETNPYTKKKEPRRGAVKAISKKLAPYVFVATKKEHLDIPDTITADRVYDLPEDAREAYDKLETELVIALERGAKLNEEDEANEAKWDLAVEQMADPSAKRVEAVALNGAVLKNKLRQVCSGFVYAYPEGLVAERPKKASRTTAWIHTEKVEAYADLRSELMGEQMLAVYGYQAEYEKLKLRDRLGGGMSDKRESEILERWNAVKLQVLGMHPASAGHGLNLHESGCCHVAFLTLPWSRGLYDQTIGRLHRMGQRRNVIVHRFVARNTVEEDVVAALETKGSVQEAVIEAMKARTRRAA